MCAHITGERFPQYELIASSYPLDCPLVHIPRACAEHFQHTGLSHTFVARHGSHAPV